MGGRRLGAGRSPAGSRPERAVPLREGRVMLSLGWRLCGKQGGVCDKTEAQPMGHLPPHVWRHNVPIGCFRDRRLKRAVA